MGHCGIHGTYTVYYGVDRCPECREAEDLAESRNDSVIEAIRAASEARAEEAEASRAANEARAAEAEAARNLGEYECPHCRQTSLRFQASRCPLCQGVNEIDWSAILDKELAESKKRSQRWEARQEREKATEEARKVAAEEWARNAPARVAAERDAINAFAVEDSIRSIPLAVFCAFLGLMGGGVVFVVVVPFFWALSSTWQETALWLCILGGAVFGFQETFQNRRTDRIRDRRQKLGKP